MTSASSPERPILLVEDNDDIRELTRMIFEREGYKVATASNGQEAIDLLPQIAEPSAVFLDLNMPVMGGREFLKVRKKQNLLPNTPVIVFAAVRDREDLEGVAEWIKKPVDLTNLLDIAKKYCGR